MLMMWLLNTTPPPTLPPIWRSAWLHGRFSGRQQKRVEEIWGSGGWERCWERRLVHWMRSCFTIMFAPTRMLNMPHIQVSFGDFLYKGEVLHSLRSMSTSPEKVGQKISKKLNLKTTENTYQTSFWSKEFIAPRFSSKLSRSQMSNVPHSRRFKLLGLRCQWNGTLTLQGFAFIKSLECMPGEGCSTGVDWSSVMRTCSYLFHSPRFANSPQSCEKKTCAHTQRPFLSAFQAVRVPYGLVLYTNAPFSQ